MRPLLFALRRRSMTSGSPSQGHLSSEQLAGYIDGSLTASDRSSVEAHLADCAMCRAEFVATSRIAETAPGPARRRVRPLVLGAVAAALLIAVMRRQAGVPTEDRVRSGLDAGASARGVLTVVTPTSNQNVSASGIRFVWRKSASIIEYTVTVQDADGRVRWTTSTSDTSIALPDSVVVAAGSVVHWYVDGLRADGRSVGSGRQQLTVR